MLEAVLLTTTNNFLGATEISYLEYHFHNMALQAKRYKVNNAIAPYRGNPPEELESDMEEFIKKAKLVIGALGYKVFEPFISKSSGTSREPILYFSYAKIDAMAQRTSEGFVVLKGSHINPDCVKSCPENAKKYRARYYDHIIDNTLTEDLLFSSPSAAAAFVGGASLSGNKLWKTKDGILLKDLYKE